VLPYSIDLSPFRKDVDRHAVRQSLGIGQSELVIGHAGRFVPQKNHEFVIEVMRELVRREPSSRLLLVGDGPLRPAMEQRVIAAGLSGVIFAGTRADVPAIMRCAMDAFLFPSHHEGLPLVLVEAQAANLPCIHTDSLSTEVVCNNPLMHPMPLSASPRAWGEKALDCARRRRANEQDSQAAVDLVDRSGFNIQTAVHRLADIYARAAGVATWGRATVV
jgi:glycosyltransferase involved in cell wall biosynthesis